MKVLKCMGKLSELLIFAEDFCTERSWKPRKMLVFDPRDRRPALFNMKPVRSLVLAESLVTRYGITVIEGHGLS